MAPNPRTAFGMVTHRKRAVLFGGILDQEGKASKPCRACCHPTSGHRIRSIRYCCSPGQPVSLGAAVSPAQAAQAAPLTHSAPQLLPLSPPILTCPARLPACLLQGDRLFSELFNELYQFSLESRRWFPVALRPSKKQQQANKQQDAPEAAAGAGAGAAAGELPSGGSGGGGDGSGEAEQRRQQQDGSQGPAQGDGAGSSGGLPAGVSPEMHALLQKMMADKGGALHSAASRIQANFRGYRVRQVGGRAGRCWASTSHDSSILLLGGGL
jgi:hypothetical protein